MVGDKIDRVLEKWSEGRTGTTIPAYPARALREIVKAGPGQCGRHNNRWGDAWRKGGWVRMGPSYRQWDSGAWACPSSTAAALTLSR
jgi:hypothetical protein